MPYYRRRRVPGGTYFFTLVTEGREPVFAAEEARRLLHDAVAACGRRRPFLLDAGVLLLDHLHLLLTLPPGDTDFSTRLASIKACFTHSFLASGGVEQPRSESRVHKRRRGIWQRWFWEHHIRDIGDRNRHLDYIHYNGVKHRLATCPHAWPFSSFERYVRARVYQSEWQCTCNGRACTPPSFEGLPVGEMEGD